MSNYRRILESEFCESSGGIRVERFYTGMNNDSYDKVVERSDKAIDMIMASITLLSNLSKRKFEITVTHDVDAWSVELFVKSTERKDDEHVCNYAADELKKAVRKIIFEDKCKATIPTRQNMFDLSVDSYRKFVIDRINKTASENKTRCNIWDIGNVFPVEVFKWLLSNGFTLLYSPDSDMSYPVISVCWVNEKEGVIICDTRIREELTIDKLVAEIKKLPIAVIIE